MVCFTRVGRFDQDFFKSFSSKPSNTVVLIMRMKRRRPFVSLTKMEMVWWLYGWLIWWVCCFSWYNPFVFQIKETILAAFQEAFQKSEVAMKRFALKAWTMNRLMSMEKKLPQNFWFLKMGSLTKSFSMMAWWRGSFGPAWSPRKFSWGLAAGKSLLNMFSYTAAFSVAAAMGGAVETTSVDLAKRSRNYQKRILWQMAWRWMLIVLSWWMSLTITNMPNAMT